MLKKGLDIVMEKGKQRLWAGIGSLVLFVVWTVLVQMTDVQLVEQTGTKIGLATINLRFHALTGVHMMLYIITDWLSLVPVTVCFLFGTLGFVQLVKRKSLMKVDAQLCSLGVYYGSVVLLYLFFDRYPVNYRPILMDGRLEASYPSSTTLLVLSVMPTLVLQLHRSVQSRKVKRAMAVLTVLYSVFMVIGRLLSGVHWLTDIVGAVLLSVGLFQIYSAVAKRFCKTE